MPAAKIQLPAPWSGGQDEFVYWSDRNPDSQVLVAPCGTKVGKALSLTELVPTPEGFRFVADLEPGDFVFDENGKDTQIVDTTEVMYGHDCYELEFCDGNTIVADAGHLWVTSNYLERLHNEPPKIRTTKEIGETLISTANSSRVNHSVDLVKYAVSFDRKDLPIDPYALGIYFGNQKKKIPGITNKYPDRDTLNSLKFSLSINLILQLKTKEPIGDFKFEDYLCAATDQRLGLIQGLMDSGGAIDDQGRCDFINPNKEISESVAVLAESLGIKVTRSYPGDLFNPVKSKSNFRVFFFTSIKVFRDHRRFNLLKDVSYFSKRRTIVSVRKVKSVPVKCITVDNPNSLFLVTKACIPTHNSFGSSLWLAKEALLYPRLFCVWIAPTYLKCKIGYRYLKAMLNIPEVAKCVDGLLEIRLTNGSFIKFLHGTDAETTIEGEACDRFIIDEAAKIAKQVWMSLLTTLTQTRGLGIVTGTPRGFNWYYDVYREAKTGNTFFTHTTLRTENSPYVNKEAVERAKQLMPKNLYDQYYNAVFVSGSSIFGDLDSIFDDSLYVKPGKLKYWIHPDKEARKLDIFHGVDLAKKRDYTVFFSVNSKGQVVGYCRFNKTPYPQQAKRLELYIDKYFSEALDNMVRYDETGVGTAIGDMFTELDIDASFTPVTFTNRSKAEMITRLTLAVEQLWLKSPRIEDFAHEMASYEMRVTKSGLHSFNAADGEHDDIVSACMLAVSAAYQNSIAEEAEKVLNSVLSGESSPQDNDMLMYSESCFAAAEDFFQNENDDDEQFEFEGN